MNTAKTNIVYVVHTNSEQQLLRAALLSFRGRINAFSAPSASPAIVHWKGAEIQRPLEKGVNYED